MATKQNCGVITKWYYTQDYYGVPDGKRNLSSVTCECCNVRMDCVDLESVDCGVSYFYQCPKCDNNYVWDDLIPEC